MPGGKFFMGSDETKYPRWLPAHQVELIRAVAAENPRCIVVLRSGSAVTLDLGWAQDQVDSLPTAARYRDDITNSCTGGGRYNAYPFGICWDGTLFFDIEQSFVR